MSEIVLSFAPSAAAVWHCDRVRITCESRSVRHSVFFKRWALPATVVEFKADVTAVILYVFVLATVPWSKSFMEHMQCRGSYGHFFAEVFFGF